MMPSNGTSPTMGLRRRRVVGSGYSRSVKGGEHEQHAYPPPPPRRPLPSSATRRNSIIAICDGDEGVWQVLTAPRNMVTLVYGLAYSVTIPLLPFMARSLEKEGASGTEKGLQYGLVMSGYFMTKTFSAPLIGFMSDRMGRRLALTSTLLGSALTFIITMLWGQYSVMGLVTCRLLMGCFAANGALINAYIGDTVAPACQAAAYAQHGAFYGVAALLAMPVLTAFDEDTSQSLLFAAVCMVLAALVVGVGFRGNSSSSRRGIDVLRQSLSNCSLASLGASSEGDTDQASEEEEDFSFSSPLPAYCEPLDATDERLDSLGCSSTDSFRTDSTGSLSSSGSGEFELSASGSNSSGNPTTTNGLQCYSPRRAQQQQVLLPAWEEEEDEAGDGSSSSSSSSSSALLAATAPLAATMERTAATIESEKEEHDPKPKMGRKRTEFVNSLRLLLSERLIVGLFILQALRPSQDYGPLLQANFGKGASALALVGGVKACCRILLPCMPVVPMVSRHLKLSPEDADRPVAAISCFALAVLLFAMPFLPTMTVFIVVNAVAGMCLEVRESTMKAALTKIAGRGNMGAFFGWQHFIKGFAGVTSNMLQGWLTALGIQMPYFVIALVEVLNGSLYMNA